MAWHTSGDRFLGNEQNGVVYYSYQGHDYSFDDVNSFRSGPAHRLIQPVESVQSRPERHRNHRRRLDPFIAYGEGIDQVTIDRMLADKRAWASGIRCIR